MAKNRQLGEFDGSREVEVSILSRTAWYFISNGIDKIVKMRVVLLSTCGPSTYKVINVLSPDAPNNSLSQILCERCQSIFNQLL